MPNDLPPLWRWAELSKLFPPAGQGGADVTGVSIDSRTLAKGDLFIALQAERDGHNYLPAAIEAGAAAALVRPGTKAPCPLLLADNTLAGLTRLGEAARQRHQGQRIAITGSSGKTTLRAWLEALLAQAGLTHASVGSFNNHLGVPLTLARMPQEARYGICEIGTNHPGEIAPLSQLVRPQVALLLNVLPAHLGNFKDMAALASEKLAIREGLGPGGTLILPQELAAKAPKGPYRLLTFGKGGHISGKIEPIQGNERQLNSRGGQASGKGELSGRGGQASGRDEANGRGELSSGGMSIFAEILGRPLKLRLPFTGEHRLQSALAALAALHALDPALPEQLAPAFANLTLPPGRGQALQVGDITILDDSYNANPVSLRLAIDALMQRPGGRKILLLGEMQELGAASPAAHKEVAKAAQQADRVITVGEAFAPVSLPNREAHYKAAADLPLADFVASLRPGDQLLVKGANQIFWKHNFVEQLTQAIKQR